MEILLLSHQLDYSGAPIALLQLAKTLRMLGHAVSMGAMRDGPLGVEFAEAGVKQFDPEFAKKYDLYIANTVLSVPLAFEISPDDKKVIAWIHESRQFFKMYNFDEGSFSLARLRRAIFPSKFQIEEFRSLMPNCELQQLRNLVSMQDVEPQAGFSEYFTVTGTWEARKNQEGLLRLVESTKLPIKINFLGSPQPSNISTGQHRFINQRPMQEAKSIISGSFGLISAAISETQNLAAIEAVMSGVPVLLSDIPAHRELKELMPNIVLFGAQEPQAFLTGYENLLRIKTSPQTLVANQKNAVEYFGSETFAARVKSLFV